MELTKNNYKTEIIIIIMIIIIIIIIIAIIIILITTTSLFSYISISVGSMALCNILHMS